MKIMKLLCTEHKYSPYNEGMPVIDISSIEIPVVWSLNNNLPLRPPFDDCVLVWRIPHNGVECAVWVSSCELTEEKEVQVWCSPAVLYPHDRKVQHPDEKWRILLDPHGRPINSGAVYFPRVELRRQKHDDENHYPASGEFSLAELPESIAALCPAFLHTMFGLALLNCKNVHAREQPCSPKLAKRYQERHGHKRPRYYVLDIEPMRQKFRDANGGKDGISIAKALHICRGHFKDYRKKPLFGKVSGMFWWQPHVRGTAEAGIVEKDYRIKL